MTEVEKYTSGPWTSHDKGIHPNPYICGREIEWEHGIDAPVIAYMVGVNTEANARLIAAAPDLLEAVKEICAIFDMFRSDDGGFEMDIGNDLSKSGLHEKITDIIAKATQVQP